MIGPTSFDVKILRILNKQIEEKFSENPSDLKDLFRNAAQFISDKISYKDKHLVSFIDDIQRKTLNEIVQKYFVETITSQSPFIQMLSGIAPRLQPVIEVEISLLHSKIQEQFNHVALRRDEMLRIVMESKKNDGIPLNGYVIDISELSSLIDMIISKGAEGKRYHVIICNDVHYTAVDILMNDSAKECAVLDAYGEEKSSLVIDCFNNYGFKVFDSNCNVPLQRDEVSCSIFSLDHLIHSCRDNSFFDNLAKHAVFDEISKTYIFNWDSLPIGMIKNSQNKKIVKLYNNRDQKNDLIFDKDRIAKKLNSYVKTTDLFLLKNTPQKIAEVSCTYPLSKVV